MRLTAHRAGELAHPLLSVALVRPPSQGDVTQLVSEGVRVRGVVIGSPARKAPLNAVATPEPRLRVVAEPSRIVKRYGNRKLYDTTASRYVKLEEIADLVRNGEDVRVLEHPSGRDITSAALAHIIFEEEASRAQRSAGLLADVIRGGAAPRAPSSERTPEEDDVIERAGRRLDVALNQAQRARAGVNAMLGTTFGTLERLRVSAAEQVDLAHDVCGGLCRARRDLERIARRLDLLHDQLRHIDG